jgi:hypothetical protein
MDLSLQNDRSLSLLDTRNLAQALGKLEKSRCIRNPDFDNHAEFASC